MEIIADKDNGMLHVQLTVVELRALYIKHCVDYEYFCPLVHIAAKAKRRKRGFHAINEQLRNSSGDVDVYECDRVVSANTCMQLLLAAGISQRGATAYRNELRSRGFVLNKNTVVGRTAGGMHPSANSTYEPFDTRMVEIGRNQVDSEFPYCDDDVPYRIGLLSTVIESNPDFICNFSFPM
jgi:hypothetical protein